MWTPENKICLVTGAAGGIGKAAAVDLARRRARVVIVCRSEERSRAAADAIRRESGAASVEYLAGDLSVQSSIRELADNFRAKYPALHILINNAGIHCSRRVLSADGIEMTFAVNHLAYFLLTNLLLDTIRGSAPARIINVSSEAHRRALPDFENLQGEKGYSGFRAYCSSKLCNLLFTAELARILSGTEVTVNALHPGVVATGIFRDAPVFIRAAAHLLGLSPEKGAQTTIHLAASPDLESVTGKYFIKSREAAPSPASQDAAAAQRLWQHSAELTRL